MAIRSPFKHSVPLSSENQPVKPVLPVAQLNIFQAEQTLASTIEPDAPVFSVDEIDNSKKDALVEQTKAIVSRTRKPTGIISVPVESKGNFLTTKVSIDATMSRLGHAGFGSVAAQANAYLYVSREVTAPAVATLDADNTVAALGEATITTFTTDQTVTASCTATLESSYYSVVDFRWTQDTSTANWSPSGYAGGPFYSGTTYVLAMRIRLDVGATLLGNDWGLSYSTDGVTWVECQNSGTDVTIQTSVANLPLPENNGDPFFEFDPANNVTSPGPGKPAVAVGRLVFGDFDQSPRVTLAVPETTELETWTALRFKTALEGSPLYFRVDSWNLTAFGTGVRTFSNAIRGPWVSNVLPPP